MKSRFLPLVLSTLGFALSAAPALAQPPPPPPHVVAKFTIPTDFDPDSITFTAPGQTFTTTNSQQVITGQLLSPTGGGGLNIFAAVPGATPTAPTVPIVEVDVFTTYTGAITLTPISADPAFTPWFAETLNPAVGQEFRFYKTLPTQAPINTTDPNTDPFDYALFTLTPDDPNNAAFLTSTFTLTGFTSVQSVPEMGTGALFGALLMSGSGLLWRRRARMSVK